MAIAYCMAFWAEENTEYIAIDESGALYWTPFLDQAALVNKPLVPPPVGSSPNHVWLPVFIPEIVSSE